MMDHVASLAQRIADQLGQIEGVVGVALGGSWARGVAHPNSDVDLGIYYHPDSPPSVTALCQLAQAMDDRRLPDLVTDFGEWGPWINGGGWLQIEGQKVDWLYRDVERVSHVIDECLDGRPTIHYQPGHPHGFHNHVYMAEVHYCLPLFDPDGVLGRLKALTTPYPPLLRQALIEKYLWEAGFALDTSRKSAERGETFYVAGCLFRSAACLVQVLFALNERYFLNEKGSTPIVAELPLRPVGFDKTVADVLAHPGATTVELCASVDRLQALVEATRGLFHNVQRG